MASLSRPSALASEGLASRVRSLSAAEQITEGLAKLRTLDQKPTLGRGQWEKFTAWVADVAGPGILPSLWVVPSLMGSMMGAYGRHWSGLGGQCTALDI